MRVLLIGESWISHSYHIKGVDSFLQSGYGEGIKWIRNALQSKGHHFDHLPNHQAIENFPSWEDLQDYNVVLLSDIGSNTLLLPPETAVWSKVTPNRLSLLKEYVHKGGGFGMIGGYMSFQGIDAKARYKNTAIEDILPVNLIDTDDRVEIPEGISPIVVNEEHEIIQGIETRWPVILGYNRVKSKDNSNVIVQCEDDPLVVVGEYGLGRTMAYTTDCAPHWAPHEFLNWEGYRTFWDQSIQWLGGGSKKNEK
ncbi:glutamine amidotransferase [Bacillus sp. IITD106]|nr:glutamine amidotransferase [Bacillus sp. IITD106]